MQGIILANRILQIIGFTIKFTFSNVIKKKKIIIIMITSITKLLYESIQNYMWLHSGFDKEMVCLVQKAMWPMGLLLKCLSVLSKWQLDLQAIDGHIVCTV